MSIKNSACIYQFSLFYVFVICLFKCNFFQPFMTFLSYSFGKLNYAGSHVKGNIRI